MKTILIAASLLLICSSLCPAQTSECNYGASPCEAYANADAVFVAMVTKIAPETIAIWQRDKDYDQIATITRISRGCGVVSGAPAAEPAEFAVAAA